MSDHNEAVQRLAEALKDPAESLREFAEVVYGYPVVFLPAEEAVIAYLLDQHRTDLAQTWILARVADTKRRQAYDRAKYERTWTYKWRRLLRRVF